MFGLATQLSAGSAAPVLVVKAATAIRPMMAMNIFRFVIIPPAIELAAPPPRRQDLTVIWALMGPDSDNPTAICEHLMNRGIPIALYLAESVHTA